MQGDPRIQLLDQVHTHLTTVAGDPSIQLDVPLLEKAQTAVSPEIPHELLVRLQAQAIAVFRSLGECPKSLSDLATKATSFITFTDVQSFLKLEDLVGGLLAPLHAVSFLALLYLSKAADSPGDTATVGSTPGLVEAIVEVWLTTTETYISEKALDILHSLLITDLPYRTTYVDKPEEGRVGTATGQGLVWRRLFHDKTVYDLFFAFCTLDQRQGRNLSRVGVSNAQGRLLDFLSKAAALNWDAVALSQMTDIEHVYNCHSLLDFAANHMIDSDDEILDYYVAPEAVDAMSLSLMSNVHHRYIATYLRTYPSHFLRDMNTVRSVIDRLRKNLDIRPTVWAHGSTPYADLLILQALPRTALVEAEGRGANPLHLIPTSPANAAAFHALASIFNSAETMNEDGGRSTSHTSNVSGIGRGTENETSSWARLLFLLYIQRHPDFWSNVGSATNVLAMEEAAVVAVNLIRTVAMARWSAIPLDSSTIGVSPAVSEVSSTYASVKTGIGALMTMGLQAFQALLMPPQPIAGAAGSDSSSAAWKIAREKWEAMADVRRLIKAGVGKDEVPQEHWETLESSLDSRIMLGPWGRAAGTGSRVQTLEE